MKIQQSNLSSRLCGKRVQLVKSNVVKVDAKQANFQEEHYCLSVGKKCKRLGVLDMAVAFQTLNRTNSYGINLIVRLEDKKASFPCWL
jgi:hypothetical protein